ncbi:extracellular solute-binding protein [Rhizobium miluonense]|uniref:sn-glycerol-3-phosphate-binding periplasmic protein UgpB n=1 Tax=Rhizobium miluonense TaxID=411945 RepID=A0A1C3WD17_9HYPH|nr:extracellular solute-binding protein [Rhizobium miluonense]SCB37959.1 multiple sugar transport system substrate-binding protein [Rhizobium miluonense]
MKSAKLLLTAIAVTIGFCNSAFGETKLAVLYAFPSQYKEVLEQLASEFHAKHPDISIEYKQPAETYDTGIVQVLRDSLINEAPDVYFNGLNQLRVLTGKNQAVQLDQFVSNKQEWAQLGYTPSTLAVGQVEGKVYGLPFTLAMPILYVNENLLKKAGGSMATFPRDWDAIVELGKKMTDPAEGVVGFVYPHDLSGNWGYQALVNSAGGSMGSADGCTVSFSDEHGKWALEQLQAFRKSGMPDMGWAQGRQAFSAGKLGIYMASNGSVARFEKEAVGKFTVKTAPLPIPAKEGRLPPGGSVAMILAKDPARQKAAFEWVKFVTGPEGQTLMTEYTGYLPGNDLALRDDKYLKGYFDKRPNLNAAILELPFMTGWYNWSGQNSAKIVDVIQNHINDVASGRTTAETTLPKMANEVQKLLPGACPRF